MSFIVGTSSADFFRPIVLENVVVEDLGGVYSSGSARVEIVNCLFRLIEDPIVQASSGTSYVKVTDSVIDSPSGNLVNITGTSYLTFTDNVVQWANDTSILAQGPLANSLVANNRWNNVGDFDHVITVTGAIDNLVVSGNTVDVCDYGFIDAQSATTGVVVVGNSFHHDGGVTDSYMIDFKDMSQGLIVSDNVFYDVDRAIRVADPGASGGQALIDGNVIDNGSTSVAPVVVDGVESSITNNLFGSSLHTHIQVQNADGVLVSGNKFSDPSTAAFAAGEAIIDIDACGNFYVKDNYFTEPQTLDSTAVGISIDGSSTNGSVEPIREPDQTVTRIPTPLANSGTNIRIIGDLVKLPYTIGGDEFTVSTGSYRFPITEPGEIVEVRAMCGTAPVGDDVIFDVNLNGTTIFTTQGNRPTIADGANASGSAVPDVTSVVAGDYLTVDVDQIGSTTPGGQGTVVIELRV